MKKLFFMFVLVSYFYSCSPTSPGKGGGPKDEEELYVPVITVRSLSGSFVPSNDVFAIGNIQLELDAEDIKKSYISYFFIPERKSRDIENLIEKMGFNEFSNTLHQFPQLDGSNRLDLSKEQHMLDFTQSYAPTLNGVSVSRSSKQNWLNFSIEDEDVAASNSTFITNVMDDDYQIKSGDSVYLILVVYIEKKSGETLHSIINKNQFVNIKYKVN